MVYQGEREMAVHNRLLGKFDLVGIPAAARGVPQIEVSFDIDANGILNVGAKDLGTGKQQQIRIESSSGLSEQEIKKMVKDAEANATSDKAEKEKVDTKNQAEHLIYQTEKTLKEAGEKVTPDDRHAIEAALNDCRDRVKTGDTAGIKATMEALTKASHKMAEGMYTQAGPQPDTAGASTGQSQSGFNGGSSYNKGSAAPEGTNGHAVDADFEVIDENK
jgi:molecular chaperone DnaK